MKSKAEKWQKAYEERVQEITGFSNYRVKKSSKPMFERLRNAYPEANPYDFIAAVTEPTVFWGFPKKRGEGWKRLKYPYPNMLVGKKAENIYKKYMKKHRPTKSSREDEILQAISASFARISLLRIDLSDLEELYHLTVNETISPFLFLSIEESLNWYILKVNKGELDSRWMDGFIEKHEFLVKNPGLLKKIKEILND